MTPEEAKSIAAFLIADFENEMQTTQRVLAAVPADRLDYQPDAKAKTGLGWLVILRSKTSGYLIALRMVSSRHRQMTPTSAAS